MSKEPKPSFFHPGEPPYRPGMIYPACAKSPHQKTFILYRDGSSDMVLECEVYATEIPGVPPILDLMCPRCGHNLSINSTFETGTACKEIEIYPVDPPRKVIAPDGVITIDNVITIKQVIECSYPTGKTICGLRLKVTEGRAVRV